MYTSGPVRAKAAALMLVLSIVLLAACANGDDQPATRSDPVPGGEPVEYPDEWKTTLSDAQARASFSVIVPNHANASPENISAVYLWPDGSAVALQFPPPASPVSPIRQEYIEIWESPWVGGDPEADYKTDMTEAPSKEKALYDIDGVVALGVTAHSSTDIEAANPAFLRFVLEGIEVEISGGESIDTLIEIAKTVIESAP